MVKSREKIQDQAAYMCWPITENIVSKANQYSYIYDNCRSYNKHQKGSKCT